MKKASTFLAILMILCFSLEGCKKTPKGDDEKWKPWTESDDKNLIEPDSIETAIDSLATARADSIAIADSLARADSLRQAQLAKEAHQVLHGHVGDKEAYINFSSINGTHIVGNAVINGKRSEISGEYTSGDKRGIVLEQMVAKKDSNTFRIEANATEKGFSGTYHEGTHTLPVTLER
ncbi:MAG: hypothetical protein IKX36_09300 [Prevotella sp.]|nr:hypothetical protein [Prevotella sp.]